MLIILNRRWFGIRFIGVNWLVDGIITRIWLSRLTFSCEVSCSSRMILYFFGSRLVCFILIRYGVSGFFCVGSISSIISIVTLRAFCSIILSVVIGATRLTSFSLIVVFGSCCGLRELCLEERIVCGIRLRMLFCSSRLKSFIIDNIVISVIISRVMSMVES